MISKGSGEGMQPQDMSCAPLEWRSRRRHPESYVQQHPRSGLVGLNQMWEDRSVILGHVLAAQRRMMTRGRFPACVAPQIDV